MIITRTPLRISFVGGGTDIPFYYENRFSGHVISMTPRLYVDVILRERQTPDIGLNEGVYPCVDAIPNPFIREALRYTNVTAAIYLLTASDVPVGGSGLGSSSATLVGVLNALYAYLGITKSAAELAKIACEIEMDILGLPSGKQDAWASALGGLNHIEFHSSGFVSYNGTDAMYMSKCERGFDYLLSRLMLFYTGQQRSSEIVLRSVSDENRIDILQKIRALVPDFVRAVRCKSESVGEILHASWELKKQLAGNISNPVLDDIYDKARKAGALGGKLLGAGGGGFFLFYVPTESQDAVRRALCYFQRFPVYFEKKGSHILYENMCSNRT